MKAIQILLIVCCLVLGTLMNIVLASDNIIDDLVIENEHIKVIVNQNESAMGRFSIHATSGDPDRIDDDNKLLLYGYMMPWTSYTTIWIDGETYVFGGETLERAGRNGKYGIVTRKPVLTDNNAIETEIYIEKFKTSVTQRLSIVDNPITGFPTMTNIEYWVRNDDVEEHEIGIRVMLDTMLGDNDGAPFRFGNQEIVGDAIFHKHELLPYWMAFDSLENPNVIAQGIFYDSNTTSVPDEVVFTNWGLLADHLWDVPLELGRDFTRSGEYEKDSAIALYWLPKTLLPGDSRSFQTYYGIGGMTRSIGDLSLGVVAPIESRWDRPFLVTAYIENRKGTATNVNVDIKLPVGFELLYGSMSTTIENIALGENKTLQWIVKPAAVVGESEISVIVSSDNAGDNSVEHAIRILSPKLRAEILSIDIDEKTDSRIFARMIARVHNEGNIASDYAKVSVSTTASLGEFDLPTKYVGRVNNGSYVDVPYVFILDPNTNYDVSIDVLENYHQHDHVQTTIVTPTTNSYLNFQKSSLPDSHYWKASLWGINIAEFDEMIIDFSFTGNVMPVHIVPGNLLVGDDYEVRPVHYRINKERRHVQVLIDQENLSSHTGSLFDIYLKGNGEIVIDITRVYRHGQPIPLPITIRRLEN